MGAAPSAIWYVSSVIMEAKSYGFGPSYWVDNLVSPVRFADAFWKATKQEASLSSHIAFIEAGSCSILRSLLQGALKEINLAGDIGLGIYTVTCAW